MCDCFDCSLTILVFDYDVCTVVYIWLIFLLETFELNIFIHNKSDSKRANTKNMRTGIIDCTLKSKKQLIEVVDTIQQVQLSICLCKLLMYWFHG